MRIIKNMGLAVLLWAAMAQAGRAQQIVMGQYRNLEPPKAYFELGYNDCTFAMAYNGTSKKTTDYKAMRAGLIFEFAVTRNIYLQFGAIYAFNGTDTPITPQTKTMLVRDNAIEIPLNLMFKSGSMGQTRFFAGAGAFLDFNLRGSILRTSGNGGSDLNIGSTDSSDIKNFGVGMDVFGGVRASNGWQLKATFEQELLNLSPNLSQSGVVRYTVLAVTITKLRNPKKSNHVYRSELYRPKI